MKSVSMIFSFSNLIILKNKFTSYTLAVEKCWKKVNSGSYFTMCKKECITGEIKVNKNVTIHVYKIKRIVWFGNRTHVSSCRVVLLFVGHEKVVQSSLASVALRRCVADSDSSPFSRRHRPISMSLYACIKGKKRKF